MMVAWEALVDELASGRAFAAIFARQQEAQELTSFARAPLEHFGAGERLFRHFPELPWAKIEAPVELGDGLKNFLVWQMRIGQCADLHPGMRNQAAAVVAQPAIFLGLPVEKGSGVGGG